MQTLLLHHLLGHKTKLVSLKMPIVYFVVSERHFPFPLHGHTIPCPLYTSHGHACLFPYSRAINYYLIQFPHSSPTHGLYKNEVQTVREVRYMLDRAGKSHTL